MQERGGSTLRKIPLSVDNSVPILFWDPIDFIAGISVFGMGVALGLFLAGAFLGGFVLWGAGKLRQGAKRGAAQHWLWFMGLTVDAALRRMGLTAEHNDFVR